MTRSGSPRRGPEEPVVLTIPQAAKLLQVSENHLYTLVAQNAIPHVRFGKLIRIPRWALLQYIAEASGSPFSELAISPAKSVDVERPEGEER